MDCFTGPDGVDYALDHFVPFSLRARVTLGEDQFEFPLMVRFRWHAWSRGPQSGEGDAWLLPRHPDDPERRLFCPDRWQYAQRLKVHLLSADVWRVGCHGTTKAGHYFRLERAGIAAGKPGVEGWYMFFQLDAEAGGVPGLELSVESLHYRTTTPTNARGSASIQLWRALADYIRTRPDFQAALRKTKGP